MSGSTATDASALQAAVLTWYDANRRDLPWRAALGERPDPYRVWLSEIMLQQTTVATVRSRYARFLERWPSVASLAAASLDEVLHEWQGLGYYARARNLYRCAHVVLSAHGGSFPRDLESLRALPGVGDYTAAAIAAIAFDLPAAPVDANIERVAARLAFIETPLPAARPLIRQTAADLQPADRPGDWAQALMDLGSTVCTPQAPKCLLCPAQAWCKGHRLGRAEPLPVKAARKARPLRTGVVYWLVREDSHVLLRRRSEKGMLGGLWEFPSAGWSTKAEPAEDRAIIPLANAWTVQGEPVRHGFTHFEVELKVLAGAWNGQPPPDGTVWAAPVTWQDYALSTLMKKVAASLPTPP